jgi:hypothetical protein
MRPAHPIPFCHLLGALDCLHAKYVCTLVVEELAEFKRAHNRNYKLLCETLVEQKALLALVEGPDGE